MTFPATSLSMDATPGEISEVPHRAAPVEEAAVQLLIVRSQAGDAEAFDELCRMHGSRLVRHAAGLCGDADGAEDLAQETLIQAWRSIGRYNGRCHWFTWLCSILIHRHRNILRKRRPVPFSRLFGRSRDETEDYLATAPSHCAVPARETEMADSSRQLLRSLDALPTKQREVVYLRFFAEESLEGIAAAVGCSVGTVKSRLFNGLERLRKMKSILKT